MELIKALDPKESLLGRAQRLPARMIKEAIVGVVGETQYYQILSALDQAIAEKREIDRSQFRKNSDPEKMAKSDILRASMVREMQALKKYSRTKRGKFLQRYAPLVHEMRTAETPISWVLIERFLKGKGYKASLQFIKDCYAEYLEMLKKAQDNRNEAFNGPMG